MLAGVLLRQAPLAAAGPTDRDEEFAAIERSLAKAWVERDEKAIDRLLAGDWTVINISGHVLTEGEVIHQAFGSQERQIECSAIDEVKVRRLNGAAVTLRFTDVFEKRSGRWQIVASQGTRIAE